MRFDFNAGEFLDTGSGLDKTAVVGTDRRLSWDELRAEVAALRAGLKERSRGLPVLIYGHKEAGMVSSILACLGERVPYIPVDTIIPAARIQRICALAKVQAALNQTSAALEGVTNIFVPSLEVAPADGRAADWQGARDLAYIIFTSGSTGEPKGVQIQRSNVADLAEWTAGGDFNFSPDDVILNQCSFSFDVSFFDTVAALQIGGCLVLNGPRELESQTPFRDRLQGLQPTVWSSTPSFLSLALTSAAFDASRFPRLKRFYVAGEVVHASLVRRLWKRFPNGELWNAYGPTEATVITTLVHVDAATLDRYESVPIGRVKPGVSMPTSAPDGVSQGELSIIGPNVSPGYLNRPDLNESRFRARDRGREYLTGDIGYHRDGLIFYLGRADDQIKLHGYRIELDEIDNQLMSLPEVAEAATIGLRRGGDVKKLVCFVKAKAGVAGTPEETLARVRAQLEAKVPYYMVPSDFRLVSELPYNTNHKVDKKTLAQSLGES